MPDMDGFETAAMIRSRRQTAQTPIIFVTAFSDEMHTAQGYSLGAVDYILSPVVPEILRTKVGVFVDLYKKTQQVRRQAEEHVALARAEAARAAAEDANRRSALPRRGQQGARAIARSESHIAWARPPGTPVPGRPLPHWPSPAFRAIAKFKPSSPGSTRPTRRASRSHKSPTSRPTPSPPSSGACASKDAPSSTP